MSGIHTPACRVGLILALLLLPAAALANDAAFAGPASDLIPLDRTRVKMLSEHIVLEQPKAGERWQAVATYRFRNPRHKPASLQLGFPEAHCAPEDECAGPNGARFVGLVTTVRGEKVKMVEGKVAANTEWAPRIGRVWMFAVTFAPREELEIVHRYGFYAGLDTAGSSITYVTRTGALWNGPIGVAEFIIRLPERPWTLVYPRGFRLRTCAERRERKRRFTEIVFKMKKWKPKRDLKLHFGGEPVAPMAGKCPAMKTIASAMKAEKKSPGSLRRVLTMHNSTELRLCRNRVFARHGYSFADKGLQKRFYGKGGLSAEARTRLSIGRKQVVVGLRVDKGYSSSSLTDEEKAYADALSTEEARRR